MWISESNVLPPTWISSAGNLYLFSLSIAISKYADLEVEKFEKREICIMEINMTK
jgi:hypothetical protein